MKISKKLISGEAAAPRRARPRNHQYSYRNIDGFEGWAGLRVGKMGFAKKKIENLKKPETQENPKMENRANRKSGKSDPILAHFGAQKWAAFNL